METRPATLRSRRVCRFCLSENDPLTYIYDRDLNRPFKVPLTLQIMSCVAIEVYAADGMPQMICNNCRWNLDRSYKFKMQCKKADEALRAYPMSGVLPRPFPPINNESPDGGLKRGMEARSNDQAKKPRLDNGSELRERKVSTQKQQKDDNHDLYEEEEALSDQGHMGNEKDDGKLEPGEIRVHACEQCDRTFPLLQSLEIHIQQAHRDRSVQCTECDRMFFNKYDLQKHMSTHSEEKPYVCQICNKQFARANLLQRHEKIHREEVRYSCSHCDREFFNLDELEKHEETVHKTIKPFQCNICHKRFTYKQGLERHEMLHNEDKSFVCDYCKESFRTSTKLSRHLQTHAGHRPFVCKLCPRTFLLSHHLTRHMRTHSVEKRHQCEECGKAFKRKESLDVHLLTHVKRTGMALTCEICQETCRNRADYVTHIKQHIEAGEKMGSDGLTPDGKEKMELESDEEEDEEEEEEQYSDGDDDYQPPSYVAKTIPKTKRMDSEEEMEHADNEHQQTQVVYVRGKDGNVLRKAIKTLMPIQRKDNTQEIRGKAIASPQVSTKIMRTEESPKTRVDETEAQVQKIVASVFKEHKIPLKTSQDPPKDTIVKQISQTATQNIKEEKMEGTPGSKTVKVIKRIVVRKADGSTASTSANSSLKDFDLSQTQQNPPTTSGPKVTKRVIVRRIIRQGDTTREVIMNPDGTLLDPAEVAKLPQGNVVKRVVVKKALDRQNIATMLHAADNKQIDDVQKVVKQVTSSPVTSGTTPKIITVQRMEPKQYVPAISKDDKETKEKLELLEKRVEQQRLKIEELQARKQQHDYDADEMITDRHDESEDEQQLPLKRVFVKRKQCIYDEEKAYYDENVKEEPQSQNVVVISNEAKLQEQVDATNSGNKETLTISEPFENAKVIVIKSNEHAPSVDEMSQELCNILESTDSVVKMQETVLNNLTEITSMEVSSEKQSTEETLTTQQEPMEQDTSISEETADSNHTVKIVVTQENEEVKLEFEQSNQSNIGEELGHSESGLSTLSTQVLSDTNDIFETSDTGTAGDKSQVNLEESVIELSATSETINLNETNDSRDSLEDKLSQMEG